MYLWKLYKTLKPVFPKKEAYQVEANVVLKAMDDSGREVEQEIDETEVAAASKSTRLSKKER